MKKLTQRKTQSQSRKKLVSMMELYEKYVDEPIEIIRIWTPTTYMINEKWNIDIQNNKVSENYPNTDW